MTLGKEEVNFLNVPTPLERLDNLSRELNLNLYIKRDNLTNYGGGGNKLRKLEYFVKDALDKNATVLMTVGGAQTNHGRLTATVAAKYGLKSIILSAYISRRNFLKSFIGWNTGVLCISVKSRL